MLYCIWGTVGLYQLGQLAVVDLKAKVNSKKKVQETNRMKHIELYLENPNEIY